MSKTRMVACPACKSLVAYSTQNPFRPFCSERCRTSDLAAWANEEYRVPVKSPADFDGANDPELKH